MVAYGGKYVVIWCIILKIIVKIFVKQKKKIVLGDVKQGGGGYDIKYGEKWG